MSGIWDRTKSEFKQLPWMLGKPLGSMVAVAGVVGMAPIWTGRTGTLLSSQLSCSILQFWASRLCSRNECTGSNKLVWLLAVVFFPLIGSRAYFFVGCKRNVS